VFENVAAHPARALFRLARNHFLHARQIRGQWLPTRMLAIQAIAGCFGQRLAFALRLHFRVADSRLQFQQRQLRIAELLAGRSVLGDQLQSQALFERSDLQFCPLQLLFPLFQLLFEPFDPLGI
jgi:hypothetical protein